MARRGTDSYDAHVRYSAIYIIDPRPEDYKDLDSGIDNPAIRIRTIATASQALRIPRFEAPLFFVANTKLPDMSGFDLREMLMERWPYTPGYLVSDTYSPEDEVRARCAGATLYFCKPLQPGWLAAAIQPHQSFLQLPPAEDPTTTPVAS